VAHGLVLVQKPVAHGDVATWTNPYGGDPEVAHALGNDRFGLVAKAEVELRESGRYRLRVVSDDGVRVLVDGKTAFEDWTWHAPTRGEAELELASGKHAFEIEYFQIDGAMALGVELTKD